MEWTTSPWRVKDPEPTDFPHVTLATKWAIISAPLVAREVGMRLEQSQLHVPD
jgi:hypothetical protein